MHQPTMRPLFAWSVLLGLSATQAHANPTYSNTATVTIPVSDVAGGQFQGSPLIDVTFDNGGTNLFTVDTGSTGVIVDQTTWAPSGSDSYRGPGSMYYSSSNLLYQGDWYTTTFQVGSGATTATITVPVLSAATQSYCPNGPSSGCQDQTSAFTIRYFGVGFAREADSQAVNWDGGVGSIPGNNPLLHVTAVNGAGVTASAPFQPGSTGVNGNYSTGYILTPQGLTLGLTAANTAGFAFANPLSWNYDANQVGASDWNKVPVTVTVIPKSGSGIPTETGTGTILTDTGIRYMFLAPPQGAALKSSCSTGNCIAEGTTITVEITPAVSYTFVVGADGMPVAGSPPVAPDWVQFDDGKTPFVNTGFHFFNQYDYLYDWANGYVAYNDFDTPESSTWAMMLLGLGGAGLAGRRVRAARIAPAA